MNASEDGVDGQGIEADEVCHGYRDCLSLIEQGKFDEAAQAIADIWPIDPRYAKALDDKLEITRRWQIARDDEAERKKFWDWMDSRL